MGSKRVKAHKPSFGLGGEMWLHTWASLVTVDSGVTGLTVTGIREGSFVTCSELAGVAVAWSCLVNKLLVTYSNN